MIPENLQEGQSINIPCPCCQPDGRRDQNALSLSKRGGQILAHCHRSGCSFQDIMNALGIQPEPKHNTRSQSSAQLLEDDKRKTEYAGKLWMASKPIEGTPAELYLRHERGIQIPIDRLSLRYHNRCPHPTRTYLPAMIARVQLASGKGTAVHRTFLTPLGTKAPREPAKAMLGPVRGGAVRLGDGGHILLGEGIETVLSAMQLSNLPGWAALSTSGLRGIELPPHVRQVTVLMDVDENGAGEAAASDAVKAIRRTGRTAELVEPADGSSDFNEHLNRLRGRPA